MFWQHRCVWVWGGSERSKVRGLQGQFIKVNYMMMEGWVGRYRYPWGLPMTACWWWIELEGIGGGFRSVGGWGGAPEPAFMKNRFVPFFFFLFCMCLCLCGGVYMCPVCGGLQTSDSSQEPDVCQYRQRVEAALAPGQHRRQYLKTASSYTCMRKQTHTGSKPITAEHYRAGQVQVLTQATINPGIPNGPLDVHSEQLTRLNVRAVASVMRQDNRVVFQPEQVSSHWPWEHST